MDPIAVDVLKTNSSTFGKPAAPAKPPFTPVATSPTESAPTSVTGKIAEALGLRKNGKILAAAGCSLLIGYAAVKYLAPRQPAAETSQPLVADVKTSQEQPKPAETKLPPAPAITENRLPIEPALPALPAGFVIPSASPSTPLPPAAPVAPAALPPTLPPSAPAEVFVPAGSSKAVAFPPVPEIVPSLPPALPVIPASGIQLPTLPPTAPAAPSTPPALPSTPVVPPALPSTPVVPPALPSTPVVPPALPSTPELPSVPPLGPPMSVIPPAVLPMTPATPPAVLPSIPPSVPGIPPTMPEPSKPLLIEYTKPMTLPETTPTPTAERAAGTTFDVDLYEPTKSDNYGTICKEFYNDAKYAAALAEYNGRRALQGGVRVEVPPIHVLKKRYPQLVGAVLPASGLVAPKDPWVTSGENAPPFKPTPPRTFTVPTGGLRMGQIAQIALGDPKHWGGIYDLNPQLSPSELIPAGTVVKIPTEVK